MKKHYNIGDTFMYHGVEVKVHPSFAGCKGCIGTCDDAVCSDMAECCAEGMIFKRVVSFKSKELLDRDFIEMLFDAAESFSRTGITSYGIDRSSNGKNETFVIRVEREIKEKS